jgi:CarD family transcriptional regulator
MTNHSSFRIGDKVVYPNHGVAIVEQINSRTVGQTVEHFYLLNIKASNLKVMVPFQNASNIGLRRIVKNGDVQKIVDFLGDGECENNADWKDRFKENSDKMRTGGLMEVAVVLKSLLALHQNKPLSFREKKMLERARYLLVSEVAIARDCAEMQAEQLLSTALAKSNLHLPDAEELKA